MNGTAVESSVKDLSRRYADSCRSSFWQRVFQAELDYLLGHLNGVRDILSLGCGPAVLEHALAEHGFHVMGTDISHDILRDTPEGLKKVVANGEHMPFPNASFDAVVSVVSLQFIKNYQGAIEEMARVLRADGRVIAMLLHPESLFFKAKFRDPHSYISQLQHRDLQVIGNKMAGHFDVCAEYFPGIRDNEVFQSSDAAEAALLVMTGTKKTPG